MVIIINDILSLMKKDINFSSVYDKYVYYIKETFYIFSEKGRLFYVGILFLFYFNLFIFY